MKLIKILLCILLVLSLHGECHAIKDLLLGNIDGTSVPIPAGDGKFVYVGSEDNITGVRFVKSSDYGETWDPVATIDGTIIVTGGDIQMQALDELTVYMAYVGNNIDPVKFAKTINGGVSWDIYQVKPDTGNIGQFSTMYAFNKNIIYVTYYISGELFYYISASTDGGVTWTVNTIDPQPTGTTSYSSVFATAADTVHVCYAKSVLGNLDLNYAKSTDSGATWTITTIDTGGAGNVGQWCSIKAFSGNLYISYVDVTNADTYFVMSTDNGASWNPRVLVDATGASGRTSIATLDGLQVMISEPVGTTIDFAKSIDGGSSWNITQVAIGMTTLPSSLHAASNSLLYIAGSNDDFFKSTDGGATWTPKATGIGNSDALAVTAW